MVDIGGSACGVCRLTGWWLKVAGELEKSEREEVKGSE